MEERSIRVYSEKTFFTKITSTLTKMLVPTRIGINSMLISIKRNNVIKAYDEIVKNKNNEKLKEDKKEALNKKYDDTFSLYLEAIDKHIMDSIYKKVKNDTASMFEKDALSKYYEVIKIRTALQKDDRKTGLSFFEGEHDIPFRISRLYTIYESEEDNQKGFHAHKQSWHLLFCPYGAIDVMIDTGKERKTINLADPSIGLILHPSVWREMSWKREGSVLCVAASGHYDADKLRDNYNEYLKFLQEKEWSATIESAEIMGEVIL